MIGFGGSLHCSTIKKKNFLCKNSQRRKAPEGYFPKIPNLSRAIFYGQLSSSRVGIFFIIFSINLVIKNLEISDFEISKSQILKSQMWFLNLSRGQFITANYPVQGKVFKINLSPWEQERSVTARLGSLWFSSILLHPGDLFFLIGGLFMSHEYFLKPWSELLKTYNENILVHILKF